MKPMVVFWVDGGVGEYTVVQGEVDVLFWDWDEVNEGSSSETIEKFLAAARRLPDDWPSKNDIIASMEEALKDFDRDKGERCLVDYMAGQICMLPADHEGSHR